MDWNIEKISRDGSPLDALRAHPAVKGVFVGGCVAKGSSARSRGKAHTHISKNDEHKGWICYTSSRWVENWSLALHELAHAIALQGHTARWRVTVLALGGTLKATEALKDYHRKARA